MVLLFILTLDCSTVTCNFTEQETSCWRKIRVVEMEFWKMFEIDSMDDLRMCSALMKEFLLGGK